MYQNQTLSSSGVSVSTTYALLNDTRDTLFKRTGILLNHMHPIETATAPDMVSRRATLTFTSISAGNSVNVGGKHIHIQMRQVRVPAGYGLYIRMGSDGTSSTAFCDLNFTYHLYPADLTTSDCGGL